jgi:hypothetical protein
MRIVSLIDERDVIEKMLKCLGLWQEGVRVDPQRQTGTDPPTGEWVYEPVDQDPFPDYPVTTLSRGTGLTWRHRTRTLLRKRLSDCGGRAMYSFMRKGRASRFPEGSGGPRNPPGSGTAASA